MLRNGDARQGKVKIKHRHKLVKRYNTMMQLWSILLLQVTCLCFPWSSREASTVSYRYIFEAIGFAFWDCTCRQKARTRAGREGCVTAAAKASVSVQCRLLLDHSLQQEFLRAGWTFSWLLFRPWSMTHVWWHSPAQPGKNKNKIK